jgi:hypothetical protein
MLPKHRKNPKSPENLCPINLLSTAGKLFEKVFLKIVQRYVEESSLLNASQFVFRARHSTTLQCMRLTDHIILNFNNNMPTDSVFLDIEKAFNATWHLGLLCKLSELKFLISLIKLLSYFPSQRKFRVSVECELYTPRDIQARVLQVSVPSPILYSICIYKRHAPNT